MAAVCQSLFGGTGVAVYGLGHLGLREKGIGGVGCDGGSCFVGKVFAKSHSGGLKF